MSHPLGHTSPPGWDDDSCDHCGGIDECRDGCPLGMIPEEWSEAHPIGTRMLYHPVRGDMQAKPVTVRSEAWRLGYGAVVAKVTGRAGGVLVSHLQPWPLHDSEEDECE